MTNPHCSIRDASDTATIAIVVPARNEGRFLQRCLESIGLQDYPKDLLEVIVVDNNSSDDTLEIAKSFGGVSAISASGNIGAIRNTGAKKSTSELIAFIDADCVAPPAWLRTAVRHIREGANVVSAMITVENQDCPWIEKCWIDYQNVRYNSEVCEVNTISSFCFVVVRKTMDEVGWFNEKLTTCEDSDLGYRISQANGKLLVSKEIATVHLRNAKTISEFYQRQVWHGGSNFKNLFYHKFELSELPSIAIPATYTSICFFLPITLIFGLRLFLLNLVLVLVIPFAMAWLRRKNGKPTSLTQFAMIWFLYLFARGIAMFTSFLPKRIWR